ncbi:hypothetical protein I203_104420 [Kwoniella mangroviensis CBS 8507]|uniref:uncharacterized protein n=1 Tax=Kwoniella mangroviensis CBS 8507 TaxID=1296122 RepID=UPI00080D5D31|nr:uncharacterized protein I203_00633 [Kwoniella mangroviensis CBS 8507]OCF70498.1 hypothetical protein I203_00633 [Kwoniella mangroviensis CBS 8507]
MAWSLPPFPHTLREVKDLLPHIYLVLSGGIGLYILNLLISYIGVLKQVKGLPTRHGLFPAWEVGLRPRLPHVPWLFPVKSFYTKPEFDIYQSSQSDLLAFTVLALPTHPVYFIGSPQLAKYICTKTSSFGKASFEKRYENIRQFGSNIVSAYDGEEHRRHKNAIRGCFGEELFEKVWENMTEQVDTMLIEEKVDEGGTIRDVAKLMIKVTFAVIGEVGFGEKIPWNIQRSNGKGEMPFVESMEAMDESLLLQFLMPSWVLKVVPSLRRYGRARRDYLKHTHNLYQNRREQLISEDDLSSKSPKDTLGALAHSQIIAERGSSPNSKTQIGGKGYGKSVVGLSEEEVISDMCDAGHETTGHALAFILANLALYSEWQDELYTEIKEDCGDEEPNYRNMNQLALFLAFALESLRQHDVARPIFKYATEDVLVPYSTWDKDGSNVIQRQHLMKKGSLIGLDLPACQKNPYHWTETDKFDPRRHLSGKEGGGEDVSYLGFSLGTRACIGKRFAEVEMVSFIARIIPRHRIKIKKETEGEEESWEQSRKRMIDTAYEDLTLTPGKFDLIFENRE